MDIKAILAAAEQGDPEAQCNAGRAYDNGDGVKQDKQRAIEWYLKAAQHGYPDAQHNLGWAYDSGEGVKQDKQRAFEWYLKAAKQGYSKAQYNVGIYYDNGEGVEQDKQQAFEWYLKAAEQGYPDAQFNVGWAYYNGEGVEQDKKQAFEWFLKAAEQGDPDAQRNIGGCYDSGEGVKQDKQQAFDWYLKAAQNGDSDAQFSVGCCYDNGEGVERDEQRAFEWYLKAAKQGHAAAQYNIGLVYEEGEGIEKDIYLAFEWYFKSAEQDYSDAQVNLGFLYDTGRGVKRDHKKAVELYLKASEQGDSQALYNLGIAYREGQGVPYDPIEAYRWFYLAQSQGHSARVELKHLEKKLSDAVIREAVHRAKEYQYKWSVEPDKASDRSSSFSGDKNENHAGPIIKYKTGQNSTQGISINIDLDRYSLPKQYVRKGAQCFLDTIREKLILVNPEEIIRQQVVAYLIECLGVPKAMIDVEVPMCHFKSGARGRADIIVFGMNSEGDKVPAMVVECKAPEVVIVDKHFKQVHDYDNTLDADMVMITNGSETYIENYNCSKKKYEPLKCIPKYADLLARDNLVVDITEPEPFKRPTFSELRSRTVIRNFCEFRCIGEDTDKRFHPFIVNLASFFFDERWRIKPCVLNGIKIVEDIGTRFTSFSNTGGVLTGDYRSIMIEDESGNNQIISFRVEGLENIDDPGNRCNGQRGNTNIVVAIDDFDKSQWVLQVRIDKHIEVRDEQHYIIRHDCGLTCGAGACKRQDVRDFIRPKAPDLFAGDMVYLGVLDNSQLITWQQPATKEFIGRLLKYALLRDKFRDYWRKQRQ